MSRDNISHVVTLTHSKRAGARHDLTGDLGNSAIVLAMFKATENWSTGDSGFWLNSDTTYTMANTPSFSNGDVVMVTIDTVSKKLTFKQGGSGGVSNVDLAKATATAADVSAGKTFYSGDSSLKTGTGAGLKVWTGYIPFTDVGSGYYQVTKTMDFKPTDIFLQQDNSYKQFLSLIWSSRYSYANMSVLGSSTSSVSVSAGIMTISGNTFTTGSFSLPLGLVDKGGVEAIVFGI